MLMLEEFHFVFSRSMWVKGEVRTDTNLSELPNTNVTCWMECHKNKGNLFTSDWLRIIIK